MTFFSFYCELKNDQRDCSMRFYVICFYHELIAPIRPLTPSFYIYFYYFFLPPLLERCGSSFKVEYSDVPVLLRKIRAWLFLKYTMQYQIDILQIQNKFTRLMNPPKILYLYSTSSLRISCTNLLYSPQYNNTHSTLLKNIIIPSSPHLFVAPDEFVKMVKSKIIFAPSQ